MKRKVITVDFDGVVMEKLWGRDWDSQGKNSGGKSSTLVKYIGIVWRWLNHWWRKPIEGSKEGLIGLRKMGYEVVLLTSRRGYLRNLTFKWMKRWGYYELYDKYFFNDMETGGAKSKTEHIKEIRPDVHIDDNWETVELLARSYPEMKLLFFIGNKNDVVIENVEVCENWNEIVKYLKQ
jgi:hypothetical protein